MIKSRLTGLPEDYKTLGLKKGVIEKWEDGRRDFSKIGACEWWYFDGILNDGITIAVSFHTRSPLSFDHEGDCPLVQMNIEFPDGKKVSKYVDCTHEAFSFGTEQCDVKMGSHTLTGDLVNYRLHVEPIDGCGIDLALHSESSPWRPDAGYFVFGDDEKLFFTWLCVIPRGKMEGTITYKGQQLKVSGTGYHDHQWTNHPRPNTLWNHWFWGRQHFEDYTLLLFDFTHARQYGCRRYPLFVLEDKNGDVVFENTSTDNFTFEVLEEADYHTFGKDYPQKTRYRFEKNGKKVEFTLTAKEVLVGDDRHDRYSPELQKELDELGFCWTYMHYLGEGALKFYDGEKAVECDGELIYELSYFGKNYNVTIEN